MRSRAMVPALLVLASACGGKSDVTPTVSQPLPPTETLDTAKPGARMVPPEVFLRSFLVWFGDVTPLEAQRMAGGANLFDAWRDYLSMLGLPNYRGDIPRAEQTNAMTQATLGRLAEALCIRTAERDLKAGVPLESRNIYAFEMVERPSTDQFEERFDVLHRTFLGYPVGLAPPTRVHRFYALYQQVVARADGTRPLNADQMAWAAICTALVLHPEAELY